MPVKSKVVHDDYDPSSVELKTGGEAIKTLLASVNISHQLEGLKQEIKKVKSVSKKDDMVRQIKYLAALHKAEDRPEEAYILHNMPVIPPVARPVIVKPGNKTKFADVTDLYRDHILLKDSLEELKKEGIHDIGLMEERSKLYEGAKAIMGVGEAITGTSRGQDLKGLLRQIGGDGGPKTGFFQSKILSKKQDFSGRATIYAEPNLGFNEMAVPKDMIWTMYAFHMIRELVTQGYSYPEAKAAVENRNAAAQSVFNRLIKQIPIIANRAPTLMQSNVTAHYPVPIEGKTLGINPIHLPLYAGDFDGDALTVHVPITPEAIHEARTKLLPEHHIYDFRFGLGTSLVSPGHEAVVGAFKLTEPDMSQEVREFPSEEAVLDALKKGVIQEDTPIRLKPATS